MSLTPGARLGPYEITALLGEGGMGKVWRAHHSGLKRDDALKVLPDAFASDPDRLARFRREAQVLASLNHPNIAHVHGLEQADGVQALVMELVEGPTLADRIAQGPISVDEALPIARQIAEALEAAHEQGIIHRDLKPANIKVRPDGTVKVLDFGLAKALEPMTARVDATASPTITSPAMMTGVGMLLGTAAYMSPEQARGKPVDKRSDIWAFGCVLYEMLTGRRAFDGDDVAAVLARVIEREPDWTALPASVPQRLRELLWLCLEKNSKRRRQAAGDVRIDLERALAEPEVVAASALEASAAGRSHRVWIAAATASALAAMVAGGGVWFATRPTPPGLARTAIPASGTLGITINPQDQDLAITRDGSRIVYVGNNGTQLLVRALDQLEPTSIATGALRGPFVSPDGQWVGFADQGGALKKVGITGGPPVALTREAGALRGATWGEDDTIIFARADNESGLQRVPAAGGEVTVLTKPDVARGEGDHVWPEFLPGGRAVLFTITSPSLAPDSAQLAVFDLQTSTYKVVVRGGQHGRYVPTGHLVYGAGGTLRAVPFDLERLEVVGVSVPVIEQVSTKISGAVNVGVAANGTLVYVASQARSMARTLVWIDQAGREEDIDAPPRPYSGPRISPDGRRVAVTIQDGENDLWIYDLVRGTLERLTFDPAVDQDPVWSPDGTQVAYFANAREGGPGIHLRAADGTGDVTRVTTGRHLPKSRSPDGTRLAVVMSASITGTGSTDIGVVAIDGKTPPPPQPLVTTPAREDTPRVSPDGRWVAFETDDTGQTEIFIRPFPDANAGRWRVSTGGGLDPIWAPDGRRLYYRSGQVIMAVAVNDRPPSEWGIPERLFEVKGRYLFAAGGTHLDIAPDGRRFLMIKQGEEDEPAAPPQIIVVQNWTEELKRLVPTN